MLVDNDASIEKDGVTTGKADSGISDIDQVLAYEYNVKGEVIEMKRDNNVDGTYDYREAYTLNANGGWTEKSIDLTNNGSFNRKEVYTKEADDGLVETKFYNIVAEDDGSTRDVLTRVEHYGLNANNRRTSVEVDTLGDETINSKTTYKLDAYGRAEMAYFDTNGDGITNRTETYVRDESGAITEIHYDTNNDGEIDSKRYYIRNENGYIVRNEFDENNDGKLNQIITQKFDEYGRVIRWENDSNNDGTVNVTRISTYNELGQRIEQVESYLDGRSVIVKIDYDEYGRNSVEWRQWTNADGTKGAPYTYTSEYDDYSRSYIVYYDRGVDDNVDWTSYRSDYDDVWASVFKTEIIKYPAGNSNTYYYELDNQGSRAFTYVDTGSDGRISSLALGDRNANSTIARTEDATTWDEAKLAKIGNEITRIQIGESTADTLTLSADVMAKITQNTIRIDARGSDDTVNLIGFTFGKEKALTIASRSENYDSYTAEVDGKTYTLYVEDEITVILG